MLPAISVNSRAICRTDVACANLLWAVELTADGLPQAADAENAPAVADGRRTWDPGVHLAALHHSATPLVPVPY